VKFSGVLAGILCACAFAVASVAVYAVYARGLSAREEPSRVEKWIARRVRMAAVPRDAENRANPVPNTPEVLAEARAHWADHCASCHGNDGSGDSMMGKRTYPPAPDMRLPDTQNMSDGALFYVIQNGVRMTAMPAWGSGSGHDEEDSWKLVRFIRHLPQLTFEEKKEMQQLNPKGPEDRKEEEEEEKFLRGDDSNAETEHHHHH
jgi:mono/diheme cytochrome c family protein